MRCRDRIPSADESSVDIDVYVFVKALLVNTAVVSARRVRLRPVAANDASEILGE
jgi:hypothetical protein